MAVSTCALTDLFGAVRKVGPWFPNTSTGFTVGLAGLAPEALRKLRHLALTTRSRDDCVRAASVVPCRTRRALIGILDIVDTNRFHITGTHEIGNRCT